jgi:hypothetical protein
VPPSTYSVQQELGYRDVIQAGAEFARQQGYAVGDVTEAVRTRPNYWRVRFALPERGSGRFLEIEFDETTRTATGAQEVEVVPSSPMPQRGPGL